jgi:hypothetical protein
MVFYFYEEAMQPVQKISVGGLVPNSFHLSPWHGNQTPTALKADTTTEIALRFLDDPTAKSLFPYADIITNNQFDTDSLLAVFTLLFPQKAEPFAATLIASAEAGAFASFSSEEGVQIHLLIEGFYQSKKTRYRGGQGSDSYESACYKALLSMLPELLADRDPYRHLWEPPFKKVVDSIEQFERGLIGVEEYSKERLSIVVNSVPPERQAIDTYCEGDIFLIIEDRGPLGCGYELAYRYYAWADTIRRPAIRRLSVERLAEELNQRETIRTGKWQTKFSAQSTCILKFVDESGKRALSALPPYHVAQSVLSHLQKSGREISHHSPSRRR